MKLTDMLFCIALLLGVQAFAQEVTFDFQTPPQQHALNLGLFEISGLAVASAVSYTHLTLPTNREV